MVGGTKRVYSGKDLSLTIVDIQFLLNTQKGNLNFNFTFGFHILRRLPFYSYSDNHSNNPYFWKTRIRKLDFSRVLDVHLYYYYSLWE